MILWRMDPTIYGLPDYSLTIGQSRTFTPYLGDKGRGRYTAYNPTAPMPVQVVFGWYGSQLAQWRQAWENPSEIAFGGNWITMTLPVTLPRGERGTEEYDVHLTGPFQASLAGLDWWKVSMTLDLDTSERLALSG